MPRTEWNADLQHCRFIDVHTTCSCKLITSEVVSSAVWGDWYLTPCLGLPVLLPSEKALYSPFPRCYCGRLRGFSDLPRILARSMRLFLYSVTAVALFIWTALQLQRATVCLYGLARLTASLSHWSDGMLSRPTRGHIERWIRYRFSSCFLLRKPWWMFAGPTPRRPIMPTGNIQKPWKIRIPSIGVDAIQCRDQFLTNSNFNLVVQCRSYVSVIRNPEKLLWSILKYLRSYHDSRSSVLLIQVIVMYRDFTAFDAIQ